MHDVLNVFLEICYQKKMEIKSVICDVLVCTTPRQGPSLINMSGSSITLVNVYVDLYLRVLPVLHRPEVVDIGVDTI